MSAPIPTARLRMKLKEVRNATDGGIGIYGADAIAILSELIRRRCERCDGSGRRIYYGRDDLPCPECGDLE